MSQNQAGSLFERAHNLLKTNTLPSIAALARRLDIGYGESARVLAELERAGIVSAVQADGERRYLGEGAEGRRAFEALAAELNAGIEPAAHWWRRLSPAKRRAYLPGIAEAAQWAELSETDKAKARSVFWRNKDKYAALRAEFESVGVAA
jgi:DNA-binding MarR family transcriptional regulator